MAKLMVVASALFWISWPYSVDGVDDGYEASGVEEFGVHLDDGRCGCRAIGVGGVLRRSVQQVQAVACCHLNVGVCKHWG